MSSVKQTQKCPTPLQIPVLKLSQSMIILPGAFTCASDTRLLLSPDIYVDEINTPARYEQSDRKVYFNIL